MALELSAKTTVLSSYGARTITGKYGAESGDDVIKHVVYEFNGTDLALTAAAVSKLDYVFPTGTVFRSCHLLGETVVTGATLITAQLNLASDGTIVSTGGVAGLLSTGVANSAPGYMAVGAGACLATGAMKTTAPTVLRCLSTVAAGTGGKFSLVVSYIAPHA